MQIRILKIENDAVDVEIHGFQEVFQAGFQSILFKDHEILQTAKVEGINGILRFPANSTEIGKRLTTDTSCSSGSKSSSILLAIMDEITKPLSHTVNTSNFPFSI